MEAPKTGISSWPIYMTEKYVSGGISRSETDSAIFPEKHADPKNPKPPVLSSSPKFSTES